MSLNADQIETTSGPQIVYAAQYSNSTARGIHYRRDKPMFEIECNQIQSLVDIIYVHPSPPVQAFSY
jgi:hypothetical protein